MRYWTRLIIVGLVFLVLGGIITGGLQNKVYAIECGPNQILIGDDEVGRCQDKADIGPGLNAVGKCMNKGYSLDYCSCKINLKGIYLNTEVPFVGQPSNPKCLVPDGNGEAGANVLTALTKILMTFVLIGGFGALVRAGVMIASSGGQDDRKQKGMSLIKAVVIAFALLGSLGVILRFINPNFFT